MCGVGGIHSRHGRAIPRVNDLADALLRELERRGTDATGYLAVMPDGKVQMEKKVIPAKAFCKQRAPFRANARTVLLHTRWATRGRADDPRNAHPVAEGMIAAVHNGTIYNADQLFRRYGLPRANEVDSQIVPALISHLGWAAAEEALDHLAGGAALGIVNTADPHEIILARTRDYPMVYMITDDLLVFASTAQAIRNAWRKVWPRKAMGSFHTLPEYSVVRVNGAVSAPTSIRPNPHDPQAVSIKPVRKRTSKRAAKAYTGPRADEIAAYATQRYEHLLAEETRARAASIRYLVSEGFSFEDARAFVDCPEVEEDPIDRAWWDKDYIDTRSPATRMLDDLDPPQ